MFSLICACINGWVNNGEAGDLRRHCSHYDATVMLIHDFKLLLVRKSNISWGICIISFITTDISQHFVLEKVRASIYVFLISHYLSEHTCVKNIRISYFYQIREIQLSWIFMQCKMLITEYMARVCVFQFCSKEIKMRFVYITVIIKIFINKRLNLFCPSLILIPW